MGKSPIRMQTRGSGYRFLRKGSRVPAQWHCYRGCWAIPEGDEPLFSFQGCRRKRGLVPLSMTLARQWLRLLLTRLGMAQDVYTFHSFRRHQKRRLPVVKRCPAPVGRRHFGVNMRKRIKCATCGARTPHLTVDGTNPEHHLSDSPPVSAA